MCAIAGSAKEETVQKMLDMMKHRSPNGSKTKQFDSYAIGMGRLAIVDLKSPGLCLYEAGGCAVAFNGEIYNYLELKAELKKLGHDFYTRSDIEVLFRAWRQWGPKCFEKFNGMFAVAITDGKQILLGRDIRSEKPLYYRQTPEGFSFASEAKALDFECKEFPPAHYGVYDIGERVFSLTRYWQFSPRAINIATADEELEDLLADSIRLRTRGNMPYGLYFSGGV